MVEDLEDLSSCCCPVAGDLEDLSSCCPMVGCPMAEDLSSCGDLEDLSS